MPLTIDDITELRKAAGLGVSETPIALIKAILLVRREINILRDLHGLSERTPQQIAEAFRDLDIFTEP